MFGKRIPLFRLFGFAVNIDVSWLLLAILITWSLAASSSVSCPSSSSFERTTPPTCSAFIGVDRPFLPHGACSETPPPSSPTPQT